MGMSEYPGKKSFNADAINRDLELVIQGEQSMNGIDENDTQAHNQGYRTTAQRRWIASGPEGTRAKSKQGDERARPDGRENLASTKDMQDCGEQQEYERHTPRPSFATQQSIGEHQQEKANDNRELIEAIMSIKRPRSQQHIPIGSGKDGKPHIGYTRQSGSQGHYETNDLP